MPRRHDGGSDPLAVLLELGLASALVLAPWPFGGVPPAGRLALEIGALLLVALWVVRSLSRPTPLPPRAVLVGVVGMLLLALAQALPVGSAVVHGLSPGAARLRETCRAPAAAEAAEAGLLGVSPATLDAVATLSLDPGATASALRTGTALAGLLLVATTVAAIRGARRTMLALTLGGAFQGLYGLLVLVSGYDRIWHVPKRFNLDAATGTFVNNNHFAGFLAVSLACGAALLLDEARRRRERRHPSRLVALFDREGSRLLLLGLLVASALAGLLTSFSRAGIALGAFGLVLVVAGGARSQGLGRSAIIGVLVLAVAAVPLAQIGADSLLEDYRDTPDELRREGGRVTVWADTARMATALAPLGAGYGTFAAVYPGFRSASVRKLYRHAHNDALQVLAESGVPGTVLLVFLLLPFVPLILRCIGGAKGLPGIGLAVGLVVFLLHSLVDFPVHIPASAATAAIVAGTLLGLPWSDPR